MCRKRMGSLVRHTRRITLPSLWSWSVLSCRSMRCTTGRTFRVGSARKTSTTQRKSADGTTATTNLIEYEINKKRRRPGGNPSSSGMATVLSDRAAGASAGGGGGGASVRGLSVRRSTVDHWWLVGTRRRPTSSPLVRLMLAESEQGVVRSSRGNYDATPAWRPAEHRPRDGDALWHGASRFSAVAVTDTNRELTKLTFWTMITPFQLSATRRFRELIIITFLLLRFISSHKVAWTHANQTTQKNRAQHLIQIV